MYDLIQENHQPKENKLMKKIILLVCAITALCSCGKSNEDKARELIEAKLKTTMNDWNSYEFVEMSKVDSVFTLFMHSEEAKSLDDQISKTKSKISEYSVDKDFPLLYGARTKVMADSIPILEQIRDSLQNLYDKKEEAYKGEFNGYKTKFTFRGNNKLGGKILTSSMYLFNKDITEITYEFSLDK